MSLSKCFVRLDIPVEDRAEVRQIVDELGGEVEGVAAYLAQLAVDREALRMQLLDLDQDVEVRAADADVDTLLQDGRHPGNIATRLPQTDGRLDAATQVDMETLSQAGNLLSRMAAKLRAPFEMVTRTKVGVKSTAWEGYPLLGDFVPKGAATLDAAKSELNDAVQREAAERKTQVQTLGIARARETLRKELRKELLAKAKASGEKLNKETRARVDKEAADAADAAKVKPESVPVAALNTAVQANTNEVAARQAEVDAAQLAVDEQLAEEFIVRAKNNILDLYNKVPKEIRERSRMWYVGANRFATALADRWGIEPMQVAGVIAAMSPQKDWFQNASLGERVVDIWHERQDHVWDDAMEATAAEIYGEAKYVTSLDAIRGKPLSAIADALPAGMWVRVFDQTYNESGYRILSPEGDLQGWARNQPKKGQNQGDKSKVQWGSNSEISKAISILMDGSRENISEALGGFHKVRNFYINILDPFDPNAVTIDTHAVAAALLRPMSSNSNEVNDSFTTPTEVTSGLKGMYVLYADAYRRAAAEAKILPREMQSITWEAVKGLFTPEFKTSSAAVTIDEHWRDYVNGEKTLAQTISRIVRTAGNIDLPAWVGRPAGAVDAEAGGTSYARELSSLELPRGRTGPAASRAGSESAVGASAAGDVTLFQGAAPLRLQPKGSADTRPLGAFRQWFGGSKVVDKSGAPAVRFHATFGDFDSFLPDGRGYIFVAERSEVAEDMAQAVHGWQLETKSDDDTNLADFDFAADNDVTPFADKLSVVPVYVKAELPFDPKNPKHRAQINRELNALTRALYNGRDPWGYSRRELDEILDSDNSWWVLEQPEIAAAIKREMFDSVYVWESGNRNMAVFDSTQLKSAYGNQGTYDPNNPNILLQTPERNKLGLYSAVEKAVLEMPLPAWKKGTDASGKDIWAKLKTSQVKKEEIDWLGIEEFLTIDPEQKFTRDEVAQFIRQNGVDVEPVVADQESSEGGDLEWTRRIWDDPETWEGAVESRMDEFDNNYEGDEWMDQWALENIETVADNYIDSLPADQRKELQTAVDEYQALSFPNDTDARRVLEALTKLNLDYNEDLRSQARDDFEAYANELEEMNYRDNPIYIVEADISDGDLSIFGNDDQGWSIRDGGWELHSNDIGAGEIYSQSEAQIQAEAYAQNEGWLTGEDDTSAARWGEYTMDGYHTNYREVKLTLPEIEGDFYEENHFPDRNVVAFLRLDDRDLSDGTGETKNTYFIDEFQSDWHQQGRQQGYSTGADAQAIGTNINSQVAELSEILGEAFDLATSSDLATASGEVTKLGANGLEHQYGDTASETFVLSRGNFVNQAFELVRKGMQHEYTGVTGEQYDFTKRWLERLNDTKDFDVIDSVQSDLKEIDALEKQAKAERFGVPDAPFKGDAWMSLGLKQAVVDAVNNGYEAIAWADAGVLMDRWSDRYESLYRTQYDKKMPSLMKKATKIAPVHLDFDGQPFKEAEVDTTGWEALPDEHRNSNSTIEDGTLLYNVYASNGLGAGTYRSETAEGAIEQAAVARAKDQREQGYWIIPITPELKQSIETEGLPLFQPAGTGPMGSFNPQTGVISAFERADLTTLLHESGHAFVHVLGVLAAREDAPKKIVDDYTAMLEWVGATSADDLSIALNGDAARAKQEKLAEAFEAYLMQGKAPSARLQSAFTTFKGWLTHIYTRLRTLGTKVDPEIARVFDRILATEQEMAEHREANAVAGQDPAIFELMTDKERATHIKAMTEAKAVDEDEAARIDLELEQRTQTEAWRKERARIEQEIEAEIWERPEYRALYMLTRGDFRTGETPESLSRRKLNRTELLEMGLTQADLNALPKRHNRIYTSNLEESLAAEELAAHVGFDSGQEMVYALMHMRSATEVMAEAADAAMLERHGDPMNDGTREMLQEEALYNAQRRAAIQVELDSLARKTGQQKVAREVTKAVVDRIFAEQPVGELLTPMKYQAASVRAAKAAERALAKKDYVKAFEQKRIQMLNHELFRRGLKARDEVTEIRDKLRKFQTQRIDPKRVDPEHAAIVKDLLHIYEFGNKTQAKLDKERSADKAQVAMAFLEKQLAAGEPIVMPGELLDMVDVDETTGKPTFKFKLKHWRSMTMEELRTLRDVADNVVARGKANSAKAKAALKKDAEDLAENIYAATRTDKPTVAVDTPTYEEQQKGSKRRGFLAAHRKLESMMRELDGFENLGPMWSAIFDGLATAQDTKTTMVKEIMAKFDAIFSVYDPKVRSRMGDTNRRTKIPGLSGNGFTHEQRVAIALNWGSESNRKALLQSDDKVQQFGEAWNEAAVQRILETLNEQDWQAVTGVWEMVNSYWSQIAELEKRTTGVTPKKVEASPFTVNGQSYAGGYYPLKYNPYSSFKVEQESQGDLQKRVQSGGFARAHTTHGFTTERVGSGKRPVRTDIGVLMAHLDEVTQDLAYREAIDRAAKLLSQPALRAAITESLSHEHLKSIDAILVKVANGHLAGSDSWMDANWMRTARINVTSALMGLNIRTILTQPLGVFQSVARIGAPWTMRGYADFFLNPTKINERIQEIHAQSAYMTDRSRTLTRELDDITSTVQQPSKMNKIREWGFKPMTFVDVVSVAYPTWLGAKAKAMAGKVDGVNAGDETAAIKYADSTVRTTQSAGGALNLSMIQQANEAAKLLTMFGSYFNGTMNMEAEAWAKAKQTGKPMHFVGQTIMLSLIPAIVGGLILERWPNEEDKEDDDELMWTKWLSVQILNYTSGQLFIVRDLVNSVTSGFDYTPSPAVSLAQSASRVLTGAPKALEQYQEGEVPDVWAKNVARTAALATGMPGMNQLIKTGNWLYKNAEDDLFHEPRNYVETVQQVLLTGDRKK